MDDVRIEYHSIPTPVVRSRVDHLPNRPLLMSVYCAWHVKYDEGSELIGVFDSKQAAQMACSEAANREDSYGAYEVSEEQVYVKGGVPEAYKIANNWRG